MTATKQSILSARSAKLAPAQVEVPELGGVVHVARMTARQTDAYNRDMRAAADDLARATIFAHAVVDPDGTRLFTLADVPALADLPNAAVEPVVDAFAEVNGLGKKPSTGTSGSSSASPSPSASGT